MTLFLFKIKSEHDTFLRRLRDFKDVSSVDDQMLLNSSLFSIDSGCETVKIKLNNENAAFMPITNTKRPLNFQ